MSRKRTMEAIEASEFVTVGELVRLTGVRYSTLKYYTQEGILPFLQPEENLTRRYRRVETLRRIEEIRELKSRGYRIPEIKDVLKIAEKQAG